LAYEEAFAQDQGHFRLGKPSIAWHGNLQLTAVLVRLLGKFDFLPWWLDPRHDHWADINKLNPRRQSEGTVLPQLPGARFLFKCRKSLDKYQLPLCLADSD
jgi:hypothetical protein